MSPHPVESASWSPRDRLFILADQWLLSIGCMLHPVESGATGVQSKQRLCAQNLYSGLTFSSPQRRHPKEGRTEQQ
jgi:hypothetical protein